MDYNNVTSIKIEIGKSFLCDFEAWKCHTKRGEIFREKSFVKSEEQVCYLTIMEEHNLIALACGNFQLQFQILSHNGQRYKVSFLGTDGVVSFETHAVSNSDYEL